MIRATVVLLAACLATPLASPVPASASERYALIVSGAVGEDKFRRPGHQWRTRLVTVLAGRLGFGRDHVLALGAKAAGPVQVASRENVRGAVTSLAGRMHAHDLLLVVLIGHGSFDGSVAKFNLVGPDLDAGEWATLLRPVPGRVIVVDTTGASLPFSRCPRRQGSRGHHRHRFPGRRATTRSFPSISCRRWSRRPPTPAAAAACRSGTVFTSASAGVRRHYEQQGLLPVEHALLDDEGDGTERTRTQPGMDSSVAQSVYLTAEPVPSSDPATRALTERRDDLLAQIDRLKAQKSTTPAGEYEARLEKLLGRFGEGVAPSPVKKAGGPPTDQ